MEHYEFKVVVNTSNSENATESIIHSIFNLKFTTEQPFLKADTTFKTDLSIPWSPIEISLTPLTADSNKNKYIRQFVDSDAIINDKDIPTISNIF